MSDFVQIYRDAENGSFVLRHVDAAGAVITTQPQIRLTLSDLVNATVANAVMIGRRAHFSGKRAYVLSTKPESDSEDGHNNADEDLYLGGVTMMKLLSYHQSAANGDYLVCRPPGGNSDGSDDVKVAVEPQLQSAITAQTMPDGTAWSYLTTGGASTYIEATQQRTARQTAGGTATLTEYITPPFLTTDYVPVFSCSNAGATVGGVAATLVAITGRQWASPT